MLKFLLKFFILLFFTINVYAQTDQFNFTGNGARAAGMGYAFTGVADDATAISWNSAGLTQLYAPEASVIGKLGLNSAEYQNYMNKGYTSYNIDIGSSFKLDFASFIIPFELGNKKVVAGISFKNQFDFAVDETDNYSTNSGSYTKKLNDKGGINAISPTIAVEINEMISVGTTINILNGNYDHDYTDENNNHNAYSVDYSGLAFDIGVFMKPSELISIGANLNLPYTLTFKGNIPFNQGNSVVFYDADAEISVPFFYSVGTGIHATDDLLLAVDFQSRNWKNAKRNWNKPQGAINDMPFANNLNSIHAGVEYLLQSGNAVIPLRAGLYTNPLLSNDDNNNQITTTVFSLGLGLVMESIIVDAAFEFSGINYDKGDNATVKVTNNRLTLGTTIHFGD